MAIRITKKDKDLIRRINQNVRAKERRLRNEYGITSDFNVKNVNKFKTRAELNNYVSEARGFTRGYANRYRKNKYGFVARVVDIHKAQYETERANKERKRQLDRLKLLEFKTRGESTGFNALDRYLMGDSRYSAYEPIKFDFNTIKNQKHFDKRLANIIESSTVEHFSKKNETLKSNILKSIKNNWGNLGNDAYKFINSLTPDEVARYYETEDVFNFEIFGSPTGLGDINKNIEIFNSTFGLGGYNNA